ncbi:MAG: hypothetical protein MUD12_17295 [Spirochaetes bacterium]|jgi:hypothetical protein|nr:hypothetical protein [Spirochaetota bacterium]
MIKNDPCSPVCCSLYFRLSNEVDGFIRKYARIRDLLKAAFEGCRFSKKTVLVDWTVMCVSIVPVIASRSLVLFAALVAMTFLYMIATGRAGKLNYFAVSFLYAIAWCSAAGNIYSYEADYPVVLGMNLWPLLCWSTAMFWGNLNFFHLVDRFRNRGFLRLLAADAVIHWFFLILCECLAYHVFGFINLGTRGYPGLPIFDCIHGPRWMQAAYLLLEPACFATIYFMERFRNMKKTSPGKPFIFVNIRFSVEEII